MDFSGYNWAPFAGKAMTALRFFILPAFLTFLASLIESSVMGRDLSSSLSKTDVEIA